jgi:hypothetical protein
MNPASVHYILNLIGRSHLKLEYSPRIAFVREQKNHLIGPYLNTVNETL